MRAYTKPQQLDMLADMTAMTTLALCRERDELERYTNTLHYDDTDVRFLLQSAVILYAEALERLGREQGFDARQLTRDLALGEAQQRWALPHAD
jgi:hypothetical protein